MKKRVLILTLIGLLFLVGCSQTEKIQPIVCNVPYILVGTSCCLDQNNDSICDVDKIEPEVKEVVKEVVKCIEKSYSQCVSNKVYWYNSCGEQGELRSDCTSFGLTCENGKCINAIQTLEDAKTSSTPIVKTSASETIYSTNFMDYGKIFHCGPTENDYTDLQKDEFIKDWIGKWVIWSGEVYEITDSADGSLILKVKHCEDTWTYDIRVTMKTDQKQKLLSYKVEDAVKYKGKIIKRIGNTYLINGEIVP